MTTNTSTATTATTATQWWGYAVVTRRHDGTPTEYAAVRYEAGKSGYKVEGDIHTATKVPACKSVDAAIVRAVDAAWTHGQGVDERTRTGYPRALANVRSDAARRARAAAETAAAAADEAEAAAARSETDAAATLALLKV